MSKKFLTVSERQLLLSIKISSQCKESFQNAQRAILLPTLNPGTDLLEISQRLFDLECWIYIKEKVRELF